MDEKLTQAGSPAPAADEASSPTSPETPDTSTEQGVGVSAAQTSGNNEASDNSQASSANTQATATNQAPANSMAEMTMEDVMAASDEQLARPPIHRGMTINGTVIMLAQAGIMVDVGAKIEGLLPYNQVFDTEVTPEEASKTYKPGDDIQVFVVRADLPNNTIVLSKKRADQDRAWNLLQEIFDKKAAVEVDIIEKVRGGLVGNMGVRAFLPASQVDVRRINDLTPYVGKRLKVKIIELNRKRNRVIISHRDIAEVEMSERKAETMQKLEPGAVLEGEVVEITDFGVFVNLGGVDGLVHRSEIGFGRFGHPREVLKVGEKVKVEVLDMDLEKERINLSMKKLMSDPWTKAVETYQIGQRVSGKVTNLTPFGAFIEIEAGLEGLIHVSEMSWTKRIRHPKEVLKEGDTVEAMVLKIDTDNKRISLGLRQTQPDPWSSLPDRYPPGTEVTGPITGITDFGVFMQIEEGIEGLVHISELAHERIDNIAEQFKKGDEVKAVILNIDPVEQRASLSRKRLIPYTGPARDESSSSADDGERPRGNRYESSGRREGGNRGGERDSSSRDSGGGGRRGGGRRSQGIDYDYSYAASDSGGKTTTKLGDVYADLFAQFGLAADAPKAEAAPTKPKEPKSDVPKVATAPRVEETPVDPANAIDAAEAAALLTAAFREGKRPVAKVEEAEAPAVTEEAVAEGSPSEEEKTEA
jgi:small subunit ribosomal protein S1